MGTPRSAACSAPGGVGAWRLRAASRSAWSFHGHGALRMASRSTAWRRCGPRLIIRLRLMSGTPAASAPGWRGRGRRGRTRGFLERQKTDASPDRMQGAACHGDEPHRRAVTASPLAAKGHADIGGQRVFCRRCGMAAIGRSTGATATARTPPTTAALSTGPGAPATSASAGAPGSSTERSTWTCGRSARLTASDPSWP